MDYRNYGCCNRCLYWFDNDFGSKQVDGEQIQTAADLAKYNVTLNDFTIGLIFLIVAVVELTKIPLATAVYYSVRVFGELFFNSTYSG